MKKKWFRTMDLVDEKFIEEADPSRQVKPLRKRRIVTTLVASAACLALTLTSLWLFLPYDNTPPSAKAYADSAYYPVIKQLSMLTWEKPKYENNFQKVTDQISDLFRAGAKGDMMNEAPNAGAILPPGAISPDIMDGESVEINPMMPDVLEKPGATDQMGDGSTYEEITDNQVEGIIEADRIKRSSTHIFYLDGYYLRIYDIAGLDSKEVAYYRVNKYARSDYTQNWAFYLSEDCKTVTIIAHYQNEKNQPVVGVISVDVSDPVKPVEKNCVEITGYYASSRLTDGKLLLVSRFWAQKDMINFQQEESFIPQINGQSIPADCIVLPEEANDSNYTVVMKLDESTLEIEGQAAFLSYSTNINVSQDHIFLTHVFADVKKQGSQTVRNSMTKITCLSYQDGLKEKGSVVVRGYVKDQWSMDEYEGILRVVTTTNATTVYENRYGNNVSADILITATGNSNASLYCVDLEKFKVIASVEDFAPPREEVQSVRFDKTIAYVCTSIEMSDPVFFFDLSDLDSITYKDTGTIDGFSSSLVNMGNGYLLGIGQENWSTFKVEIYRETETGVEGFCKYTQENVRYSQEYKSYYIDRENQLIGLGISPGLDSDSRYILLHFNGAELIEVLNVELPGSNELKRGVYIDGFMYLFGQKSFIVKEVVLDITEVQPGKTRFIIDIVDRTKEEDISYDTALEKFYEDETYEYYFGGIKSQYILVSYNKPGTEDVVTALNAGRATIEDLDKFGIEYYTKKK